MCHQRTRRNVPVYLHEEVRLKELEEHQLLLQYQSLKDMDKQLKDEEKRNTQRMDRAKIDAFNLGVSEAQKAKKMERPKTSDISVTILNLKKKKKNFFKLKNFFDFVLRDRLCFVSGAERRLKV